MASQGTKWSFFWGTQTLGILNPTIYHTDTSHYMVLKKIGVTPSALFAPVLTNAPVRYLLLSEPNYFGITVRDEIPCILGLFSYFHLRHLPCNTMVTKKNRHNCICWLLIIIELHLSGEDLVASYLWTALQYEN